MMQTVQQIQLSQPQLRLISTPHKFPAFVGGFGSGKTEALINRGLYLKTKYPLGNIGYYLPTYDLVRMIGFPRFEEKLEAYHIPYKSVTSPRPLINIENAGQIIFRTMDNPNRIVGYEVMDSLVDEIDILKPIDAENAWNKILARNRQKKIDGADNTIAVGCTPEGFKFVYNTWKKDLDALSKGHELIKASTYSNLVNLPKNYINDLLERYNSQLVMAYIYGEFVNLNAGAVYPDFDRILNGCDTEIGLHNGNPEDLHIGMDFNVTKMAAVVNVRRDGWPHAVAEITRVFDTPAMIKALKAMYPKNRKFVYPDASGSSRKSVNASQSDIDLLNQAGFYVMAKDANPQVKNRVLSINVMIKNAKDERRFKVNIKNCPNYVETLETQAYNENGEPDKSSGLDHLGDAEGYFMDYCFPVRGKPVSTLKIVGL